MAQPPRENKKTYSQRGNPNNEPSGQKMPPRSISPAGAGLGQNEPPADENYARGRSHRVQDWPTLAVNILTLLAVGAYTLYARNQVTASQNANAIAQQALIESNKPYIMWSGFQPYFSIDNNGQHFRLGLNFTNYGNTPASDVSYYNCDPIIRDDQNEPPFNCNISEKQHPGAVIGPKQTSLLTGPVIERSDLDATSLGKKSIYVYGFVKYSDAVSIDEYGNRVKRVTEFCQKIVEATPPLGVPSPPQGSVAPLAGFGCSEFNCADDACKFVPKT